MELWRNIKGFENIYQVSNTGKIKSLKRKSSTKKGYELKVPERILSQRIDKYGYLCVSIQSNGSRMSKTVHRLVIEAFSNETPKRTVNHKDGNKLNNHISNLEWATIKENIHHAINAGLRGTKEKRIGKFKDGIKIAEYKSIKEAAEKNNKSTASINYYCLGKRNSKDGFIYKYL